MKNVDNYCMINNLTVVHLSTKFHTMPDPGDGIFVLKTCQRTLVVSLSSRNLQELFGDHPCDTYQGKEGYLFLLQTICGLKSKVLGEHEIVHQFKEAFQEYIKKEHRDTKLMRLLEKLFKDAKKIRSEYLVGIGQKTYSGLVRKFLTAQGLSSKVLIIGSGELAKDCINQLKPKTDVYISGRNEDKVGALCAEHNINASPWKNHASYEKFPQIVNTIGANLTLFDHQFFSRWKSVNNKSHLFLDLGSPSTIETAYGKEERVLRLEDFFHEGSILDQTKIQKIEKALLATKDLASQRCLSYTISYPYSWEGQNIVSV